MSAPIRFAGMGPDSASFVAATPGGLDNLPRVPADLATRSVVHRAVAEAQQRPRARQ